LLSPTDTATGVVRNPTLDWEPVQNATEYQVQISSTSSFSDIVLDEDVTETEITLGTPYLSLDPSTTYHWRVRTADGQTFGDWSSEYEFTTESTMPGSGTQADPYLISTPQDLDDIRNNLSAYYEMTQDIDLTYHTQNPAGDFYNAGTGWLHIDNFAGNLDLGGYSIIGLYINDTGHAGFFDNILSGALIHSGKFVNADINGASDQGVIDGGAGGGLIREVVVEDSTIASGNTTSSRIGGFSGRGNSAQDVIARNLVLGGDSSKGANTGRVFNSSVYTRNLIHNVDWENPNTTTDNPLFGWIHSGGNPTVNDVFYVDDTLNYAGSRSDQGTGVTTAQAQNIDTYNNAGWDIVTKEQHDGQRSTAIWYIDDGNDYPRLWFEYEGAGWHDDDWQYREKVTIKSSAVDTTLEDFPVYLDLADFGTTFFENVKGDGGDIRVTKADGTTELAREVVSVSTSTSAGEVHFKADRIASTTDTVFYVYYGNPDASEYATDYAYGAENVWNSNYVLVTHDGGATDSTRYANNGTANGDATAGIATGKVGTAAEFDGVSDSFQIADNASLDITTAITITAWVQADSFQNFSEIVSKGLQSGYDFLVDNNANTNALEFVSNGAGVLQYSNNNVVATGGWYHVATTYDKSNVDFYANGLDEGGGAETADIGTNNDDLYIGGDAGNNYEWNGLIDEVRILATPQSAAWISAGYTNQSTTTNFYTVNTENIVTMEGSGSQSNPYLIETPRDLYDVRYNPNSYYQMINDIDMSGFAWEPIPAFAGEFDGGGYDISNLSYIHDGGSTGLLFTSSTAAAGVYIHDLSMSNASLSGDLSRAGIFFGIQYYGLDIERVRVQGEIRITSAGPNSQSVGGLIGRTQSNGISTIDTYTDVNIINNSADSTKFLGGFVGDLEQFSAARQTYAIGSISGSGTGYMGAWLGTYRSVSRTVDDSFFSPAETGISTASAPNSQEDLEVNTNISVLSKDISDYTAVGWDIVPIEDHDGQKSTATWYIDDGNDYPRLWFEREIPDAANWDDASWPYREKITVASTSIAATLNDFPVYVDLADLSTRFFDNVDAQGADVRITSGDGTTELAREVVSLDVVNNTGELHFKADTVSSSTDSDFYIYYGNAEANDYAATDTYGRNAVWSNGYNAVYHMQEDPSGIAPQIADSTGGVSATTGGTMTSGDSVAGELSGNALDFEGTDDHVQMPQRNTAGESEATLSLWLNPATCASTDAIYDEAWDDTSYPHWWQFSVDCSTWRTRDTSTGREGSRNNDLSLPALSNGSWQYLTFAYSVSNSYKRIYLDGVQEAETTTSVDQLTSDEAGYNYIARPADGSYFDGNIDEVRVSSVTRSSDWVAAEYLNQDNTTNFYTVAAGEEVTSNDVSPPTPDPGEFSVLPDQTSTSSISMTAATSTDGEGSNPVEYYFNYQSCTADNGSGGTNSGWLTSTSYADENLQINQCYSYRVKTRDSLGNETAYSATSSAYTAAAVPDAPSLSNPTETSLDLVNNEGLNPTVSPDTSFAVQVSNTSPGDMTWTNQYVDASGNPSPTAVWLTDSQLSGLTVNMLEPNITYTFRTKARNQDGDETGWSGTTVAATDSDFPDETDTSTRLRGGSTIRGGSTAQ
jgi:hypothetical protein